MHRRFDVLRARELGRNWMSQNLSISSEKVPDTHTLSFTEI